jgi:Tfp pilus assembly protein FimT
MNGNQVFLGSFPTESQAWLATRKAAGEEHVDMPTNRLDAQHVDLQAVSMEAIIDAYETQYDPAVHTFSLHNWTLTKINHHCYMREKQRVNNDKRGQANTTTQRAVPKQAKDRKGKRKGLPRKLASYTSSGI